ncbi:TetR family transcriptional regulator C-terminal domain-containing protein [Saccharopolyspora sp. K220]|uniref:TetR/AcrR family transcriptional regulator n=1 Tax=Saccharopolyspora soli TaxID=2926618 RepID=UPI001F561952|nr:TetR family transcriptional regulator C-terminal domain-containing protein [Saccharopolyspora soli]MCI2420649.1 TetR family transcriptional regulator C-terminal domain-containing protein [Saccharopolyspora soli]
MTASTATSTAAKRRIVDAVFRLVVRGGVGEASLRKVAEESGINIGSVRHYFGSHERLMVAAAEEVGARMQRRLHDALPKTAARSDAAGRRELVEAACRAVLPVSDRAEAIVLVELITAARLRPEFRPLATRMGTDLRAVLRETLEAAHVPDPGVEAERLTALVGGLTFEVVYPHGSSDDELMAEVLRRHIAGLIPE